MPSLSPNPCCLSIQLLVVGNKLEQSGAITAPQAAYIPIKVRIAFGETGLWPEPIQTTWISEALKSCCTLCLHTVYALTNVGRRLRLEITAEEALVRYCRI